MTKSNSRDHIFALVSAERARQEEKFPGQKLPLRGHDHAQYLATFRGLTMLAQARCEALTKAGLLTWTAVLWEEVVEAISEMLDPDASTERVGAELIQVMAVCSRIMEDAEVFGAAPEDLQPLVVRFPRMLNHLSEVMGLPHNGWPVVGCVIDGSTFMVDVVGGRFRATGDVGGKKVEAFSTTVRDAIRACQRDAADHNAPAAPAPDPLVEEMRRTVRAVKHAHGEARKETAEAQEKLKGVRRELAAAELRYVEICEKIGLDENAPLDRVLGAISKLIYLRKCNSADEMLAAEQQGRILEIRRPGQPIAVAVYPSHCFGRPVVMSSRGIAAEDIVSRVRAGDTIEAVAADMGLDLPDAREAFTVGYVLEYGRLPGDDEPFKAEDQRVAAREVCIEREVREADDAAKKAAAELRKVVDNLGAPGEYGESLEEVTALLLRWSEEHAQRGTDSALDAIQAKPEGWGAESYDRLRAQVAAEAGWVVPATKPADPVEAVIGKVREEDEHRPRWPDESTSFTYDTSNGRFGVERVAAEQGWRWYTVKPPTISHGGFEHAAAAAEAGARFLGVDLAEIAHPKAPLAIGLVTCDEEPNDLGFVYAANVKFGRTHRIHVRGKYADDAAAHLIYETAVWVNRPVHEVARAYLEVASQHMVGAGLRWPHLREAAQELSAGPTVEASEEASIPWARVYTDKIVERLGGGPAPSLGEAVTRICDAHDVLEDRLNCVEKTLRDALAGLLGEAAVHSPSSGFPLPIDKLAELAVGKLAEIVSVCRSLKAKPAHDEDHMVTMTDRGMVERERQAREAAQAKADGPAQAFELSKDDIDAAAIAPLVTKLILRARQEGRWP